MAPPYYIQRTVFASHLSAFFIVLIIITSAREDMFYPLSVCLSVSTISQKVDDEL